MPIDEKQATVNLDVYSVTFAGDHMDLAKINEMQNVNASFRYNAGAFQMIVLSGVELEGGVSIVDYAETLDKVVVFYTYDKEGRLMEDVELGEFLNKKVLSDMRLKMDPLLFNKRNPWAFIVDSYQEDEDKIVKLLPTDFEIGMYV